MCARDAKRRYIINYFGKRGLRRLSCIYTYYEILLPVLPSQLLSYIFLSVSLSTLLVPYTARQAQRENDADQLKEKQFFTIQSYIYILSQRDNRGYIRISVVLQICKNIVMFY